MPPEEIQFEPVSEMIKDKPKRTLRDSLFQLLAGVLIIGGALLNLYRMTDFVRFLPDEMELIVFTQAIEAFYFSLIIGVLLFVSSALVYLSKNKIGAILGLICSFVGFLVPGAGFIIGPILGIVGGLNVLVVSKPPAVGDPDEIL